MSYAKVHIKIPQIARWRVAGISDTRIAELLKMTTSGLARILATPEYKEFEASYLNGQLTEMDRRMAGRIEEIHNEARAAVPAAMRCLVEAVTQKKDLRAAIDAAKEILDRDPDRALVKSRTGDELAQGVPMAVLDRAASEGNDLVKPDISGINIKTDLVN
jgi:hypothetical protein